MGKLNKTGPLITIVGALLLVAQFVIAFTLPADRSLYPKEGLISYFIHFTPYILLLIGVYLSLPKNRTPGIGNKVGRITLTIIASWGLAGVAYLIGFVLMSMFDSKYVESVFSYLPAILIVLTTCLYPLVYKQLR